MMKNTNTGLELTQCKCHTLGEKSTGSTPRQSNTTTVLKCPESSSVYGFIVSLIISENRDVPFKIRKS